MNNITGPTGLKGYTGLIGLKGPIGPKGYDSNIIYIPYYGPTGISSNITGEQGFHGSLCNTGIAGPKNLTSNIQIKPYDILTGKIQYYKKYNNDIHISDITYQTLNNNIDIFIDENYIWGVYFYENMMNYNIIIQSDMIINYYNKDNEKFYLNFSLIENIDKLKYYYSNLLIYIYE